MPGENRVSSGIVVFKHPAGPGSAPPASTDTVSKDAKGSQAATGGCQSADANPNAFSTLSGRKAWFWLPALFALVFVDSLAVRVLDTSTVIGSDSDTTLDAQSTASTSIRFDEASL
jgi:hypothetical protein